MFLLCMVPNVCCGFWPFGKKTGLSKISEIQRLSAEQGQMFVSYVLKNFSDDQMHELMPDLIRFSATSVNLSGSLCDCSAAKCSLLIDLLQAKRALLTLDLSKNKIASIVGQAGESFVPLTKTLLTQVRVLKLHECGLGGVSNRRIKYLAQAIMRWRPSEFDISFNYLNFMPVERLNILTNAIVQGAIEYLRFCNNGLNRFDFYQLSVFCNALARSRLTRLDLSHNNLGSGTVIAPMGIDAWRKVFQALVVMPLTELNLSNNDLYTAGLQLGDIWRLFTSALTDMRQLKVLNLRANQLNRISHECRQLLADSLISNYSRPTLILDHADDPNNFWANLNKKKLLSVQLR